MTGLPVSGRGLVPPFRVMRVLAAAMQRRAAGLPVYDLSAGQPAAAAPAAVRAAARAAVEQDRLGYSEAAGLPALRAAIAGHYRDRYGLAVGAQNVVVTTGSSGGILLAFLACFGAGDRVGVVRPGYPAYRNLLTALDCVPVDLVCGAEQAFAVTAELIRQLPDHGAELAGLILASPANPTGSAIEPETLAQIAAHCRAKGIRLISDEIYHGIRYRGIDACAWQYDRSSVVVGSFSKYFAMTGWRLGWLLVPDELLDPIDRLATNVALCPPTLSQLAAMAAFDSYPELDAHVAQYRANRDVLLAGLTASGVETIAPADGAFYLYADVSAWTADSEQFAARLLAETGVAVAPGIDFDPVDGGRFVRMSFAGPDGPGAVEVLGNWLSRQPRR